MHFHFAPVSNVTFVRKHAAQIQSLTDKTYGYQIESQQSTFNEETDGDPSAKMPGEIPQVTEKQQHNITDT